MIVAAEYSFNNGKSIMENSYIDELNEIKSFIAAIDSSACKNKISKEKTTQGKKLYSPTELNKLFKQNFNPNGWSNYTVKCDYKNSYYVGGYTPKSVGQAPYRDMDFVKGEVGVEVQFGKYSFMVYNVCAKMTIFSKLAGIKVGVEIVPIKDMADQMSSGVSYFEQFVWDLEERGVSNIDIPVLIMGIAPVKNP